MYILLQIWNYSSESLSLFHVLFSAVKIMSFPLFDDCVLKLYEEKKLKSLLVLGFLTSGGQFHIELKIIK